MLLSSYRSLRRTRQALVTLIAVLGSWCCLATSSLGQFSWSVSLEGASFGNADIYFRTMKVFDDKLYVSGWEGRSVYEYDGVGWVENARVGNELNMGINPYYNNFVEFDAGDGTGNSLYLVGGSSAYGGRGAWFRFDGIDRWDKAMPIPYSYSPAPVPPTNESPFIFYSGATFDGDMYIAAARDEAGNGTPTLFRLASGSTTWQAIWTNLTETYWSSGNMIVYDDGGGEQLYIAADNGKIYSYDGINPVATVGTIPGSEDILDMIVHRDVIFMSCDEKVYTYDGSSISLAYDFDVSTAYVDPGVESLGTYRGNLYVLVEENSEACQFSPCWSLNSWSANVTTSHLWEHTGDDPTLNWSELLDNDAWPHYSVGSRKMMQFQDKLYIALQFGNYSSHLISVPALKPKVYALEGPPYDRNIAGLCVICP